jgi:uncharacterized protein
VQISRFVLEYDTVRPGEHVLYDVISDRYVGVDDATRAAIARWVESGPRGAEEKAAAKVLGEAGILVEDEAADGARLRTFLERANEGIPETLYVLLMPTLACNLACTYCFQKDHPATGRMQTDTEAATLEWILRKVDETASRTLAIHYFGGEPLTRKDLLLRSAEVFSSAMKARGGEFRWEITTNGIGLTVDFVRALLAFGPGTIKITLDGDQETHDAARVWRSGKGSFEEIFERTREVARACPEVALRLGGNFQPGQLASYERLLDKLEAAGLAGAFELIRFKPVVATQGDDEGTCTSCARSQDLSEQERTLADSVARRGLSRTPPRKTPTGPCQLHWKRSYVIDPEGRVYKCPAVAGKPELAVGHVQMPRAKEKLAPLLELRPWEKCGACPYLPVCVGGCLGGKYLETGRKDEVFCRKDHFERAFREEITERYLAEFGGDSPEAHGAPPDSPGGPAAHPR